MEPTFYPARFSDLWGGNDKCEDCGIHRNNDSTVKSRICPYQQDVNDREVWVVLCDDCAQERAWDI